MSKTKQLPPAEMEPAQTTAVVLAPIVNTPAQVAAMLEQVIIKGNLAVLSAAQKVSYYRQVCGVVGIPVELQPFEYLTLNGREVLYARRAATEYLRDQRGIACRLVKQVERPDGLYEVLVEVEDRTGRKDFATGIVDIKGLSGEKKGNAILKAETKAKRRATLSISGLGMLDETEVDHPGRSVAAVLAAEPQPVPQTFQAWRADEPFEDTKRALVSVTSARETTDDRGSLVRAMVAYEDDSGTIEVATRDMSAFDALRAAAESKALYSIRFDEIETPKGIVRKLLAIEQPYPTEPPK